MAASAEALPLSLYEILRIRFNIPNPELICSELDINDISINEYDAFFILCLHSAVWLNNHHQDISKKEKFIPLFSNKTEQSYDKIHLLKSIIFDARRDKEMYKAEYLNEQIVRFLQVAKKRIISLESMSIVEPQKKAEPITPFFMITRFKVKPQENTLVTMLEDSIQKILELQEQEKYSSFTV